MAAAPTLHLKITNIPSVCGVQQIRKWISKTISVPQDQLQLRKAQKWDWAFLMIKGGGGGEQQDSTDVLTLLEMAKQKLDGSTIKGRQVKAVIEEKVILSMIDDFKGEEYCPTKTVMDQVTPLWKVPYAEQLLGKQNKLSKIVSIIDSFSCVRSNPFPDHLTSADGVFENNNSENNDSENNNNHNNNNSKTKSIIASPTINGYRNKCEFTIAYDYHNKHLPTVGFLMGRFKDGHVRVGNAEECLHVPPKLKELAAALQSFIRREDVFSVLKPMDRSTKEGFWRLLLGRIHNDQVMAVVQVSKMEHSSVFASFGGGGWNSFLDSLKEAIGPLCESLSIQQTQAMNHGLDPNSPIVLLAGEETLGQDLLTPTGKLTFAISPLSFFQVNTAATELLYSTIRELAIENCAKDGNATDNNNTNNNNKILLDLCCGTGTIGMIMSGSFKKVYGIDIAISSIEDAKKTALKNGLSNIEFEVSPVEKKIDSLLKQQIDLAGDGKEITEFVVVLDPPRNGVHTSVIRAVRRCALIKRVVFVACNADASKGNMMDLVRASSKSLIGEPFALEKAIPVDLFPHTHHCELVVQFCRK